MARLYVNAPYMLYFALWPYRGKWSYEVNISTLPRRGQVVCLLSGSGSWWCIGPILQWISGALIKGNTSTPPHSGQVVY